MSRLHAEQVNNDAADTSSSSSLHEGPVAMENVALLDLDIDHVSRLVLASERSLALVNRRALAATLANMTPDPGQALPPAPPFAEAVAIAREDGQLVERIRLFLATHPRAIEELTPELTRTLVRIFDPSGRTARLINTRSPILSYAVTGAAVVGALTLLTSAGLLIGTVANRFAHPGSPAISEQARPVSPLALSRIPNSGANNGTGGTPALRVSDSRSHTPVSKDRTSNATATTADGAKPVDKSAQIPADAKTSPAQAATTVPAATSRDTAINGNAATTNGTQANRTTAGSPPATEPVPSAATKRDEASKESPLNELPPYGAQAIKATGSAASADAGKSSGASAAGNSGADTKSSSNSALTKVPGSASGTAIVPGANSGANSKSAATTAESGKGDAASQSAQAATDDQPAVENARDIAARAYVNRNITTVNPDARVEWMHSNRTAPGIVHIDALIRTEATSSIVHYTLHDDGSGFTLVDKTSAPNT